MEFLITSKFGGRPALPPRKRGGSRASRRAEGALGRKRATCEARLDERAGNTEQEE
jgi:hypothetical protein